MIVLGIDPGIKNMGICLARVDKDDVTILEWKCIQVDDSSSQLFVKTFKESLDMVLCDVKVSDIEDIRVESQPTKNYRLKRIQHYIDMYFALFHPKLDIVTFVSPQKKKRYTSDKNVDSYYKRKKASVQYVDSYLGSKNTTWKEYFLSHTKKDDLAESLLLVLVE